MSFWDKLGFKSFGPELVGLPMVDSLKMVKKHLHGEGAGEIKRNIDEALRIYNLQGITASTKLRSQEALNLKYTNGTLWLTLVFALLEQDKSILVDVLDLPGEVRKILAQEKEKRISMPEAMQKLFDAVVYMVEQKHIFNASTPSPTNDSSAEKTEKTEKTA